jgi:hypothetical protein
MFVFRACRGLQATPPEQAEEFTVEGSCQFSNALANFCIFSLAGSLGPMNLGRIQKASILFCKKKICVTDHWLVAFLN